MDFKKYLNNDGDPIQKIIGWFSGLWSKFKNIILSSAKMSQEKEGSAISFHFPSLGNAPIQEAYAFDKGERLVKNIDTTTWKDKQRTGFAKMINRSLKNIGGIIGKQFEFMVASYLINKYNLTLIGVSQDEFHHLNDNLSEKIKNNVGNQFYFDELKKYIENHAQEVANEMYRITLSMLKCKPNKLEFNVNSSQAERKDVSDIKLVCSKDKNTSWSLKYTSNPLVSIAQIRPNNAYKMLTGMELDQSYNNGEDKAELLENLYDNLGAISPKRFTNILNSIINGPNGTLVATKNYITNTSAVGEPSDKLQKDFIINKTKSGVIFNPKPGAKIEITKTKEYIRLKYVVPGGAGTYLTIELQMADGLRVTFKMNNLR